MKIFIKNMVSTRCIMMVKAELDQLDISYYRIELGAAELLETLEPPMRQALKSAFDKSGLELIEDKKTALIEKIKNVIVELVHFEEEVPKCTNSEYISQKLKYDYTYLANVFSESTGSTIEKYIILHKIERVKELIIYEELNFSEIAWKLHYSSVAHLSNQFKKVTGLTPTYFKALKQRNRIPIENLLRQSEYFSVAQRA